jgi:lipopolysaccharide export system protein LptA
MANSRTVRRNRIGLTASAWVLFFSLAWPLPGLAQIGMPGASGGDDGPIRIQADSGIEWQQNQRVYIARGNAVAGRGNNEVRADMLIAYYREKAGAKRDPKTEANTGLAGGLSAEGGDNIEIFRVEAVGNVVLKHEASTVVGERAVYDIDQGVAMITGANLKLTTATDVVTARDSLEWYEGKQIAVARGDAVATRSGKTIKADILTAYMRKSATPPAKGATPAAGLPAPRPIKAPGATQAAAQGSARGGAVAGGKEGESRISRVDAQGHVVISDTLNTGRGDYGVYNGDTGIATLIGNVVIQRGANVIQGQRGVMDLNSNIARMMPGSGPDADQQRVQGLLVRDQAAPGAAPAGNRKHP